MKKSDVKDFYKTQTKIANALGITAQAVHAWAEIIPERAALKLEKLSNGMLSYDASLYIKQKKHPDTQTCTTKHT